MVENRREQIKKYLITQATEDLLNTWQNGIVGEWEEEVFEIVKEILLERLGYVPPQSGATQASQFLVRAEGFLERKELDKALHECEAAIQIDPDSAIAYKYLGHIYDEMEQLENSITNFQKAIRLDPDLQDVWEAMLLVELDLEDEFEESPAKQYLDQALEYANNDEIEKALAKCEEAKSFMPSLATAYNYLGLILQTLNELEAAIDAYLKAIELNPRFYVARENLANARVVLEEEYYLRSPILTSNEDEETKDIDIDKPLLIVEGENPIPGWMYLDANAFLLRGWAGHRNRPGRSGYDPLDTDFELAHMEGVVIRRLITLKFRTKNPLNLLIMLYLGILYSFYGGVPFMLGGWEGLFLGFISSPYLIIGLAMLINVFSSLWHQRPSKEDNGHTFF
ncbi:MAG TPA: hypothetical protein DCX53_11785 [Anaerolineae bacterium]|nr:hypothetical protein [Anaerolineae bacterium]